jgi:hypothetical protein
VRPGITGWAQVNGRNAIGWGEKFRLDVWYVDNRSFALDMRILLLTLKKVFVREGISQHGQATMERFRGGGSDEGRGIREENGDEPGVGAMVSAGSGNLHPASSGPSVLGSGA